MPTSDGTRFLPFPGDDEIGPEAAATLAAFQTEHPGPVSNLDRTLLGSATVFDAYLGWYAVRDEAVPYLGERAVDLFALAISRAYGAPYPVAFFEQALRNNGDHPDAPVVTEAEGLLLEWGAAIGAHAAAIPAELTDRVAQTFQPKLRLALTAFAGQMVAVCVFSLVGQVPAEQG
ncbi:hypothetical protein BH09ACT4_BH09ACT4_22590 [soil metagenome]